MATGEGLRSEPSTSDGLPLARSVASPDRDDLIAELTGDWRHTGAHRFASLRLRIKLEWRFAPSRTQSVRIAGSIALDGLVKDTRLQGEMRFKTIGREPTSLSLDFCDAHQSRYRIEVDLAHAPATAPLHGALKGEAGTIGEIRLHADREQLADLLPGILQRLQGLAQAMRAPSTTDHTFRDDGPGRGRRRRKR